MNESSEQFPKKQKNAIRNIFKKISEKVRGKEQTTPIEIQIFDESDPQNILSDKSRNLDLDKLLPTVYSKEGFAENQANQESLARFLIEKLGLKNRGVLLDVGFGANIHISNAFTDEEIKAYAIDEGQDNHAKRESPWHAPRKIRTNEKGVEILSGDIAELDSEESAFKDAQFGLILFNGSWTSGGNNFTVAGEVMEAKYHNRPDKTKSLVEFMDREKEGILRSCREHLTKDGIIGIVSSRYAFHGAGYDYEDLPSEKLDFIDIYNRFRGLGARRIYLFGVTQKGFDEMLARSIREYPPKYNEYKLPRQAIESVRKQLKTVFNLPREDVYSKHGSESESKYQKARISNAIDATKNIPEFNNLARIDAIFAEF